MNKQLLVITTKKTSGKVVHTDRKTLFLPDVEITKECKHLQDFNKLNQEEKPHQCLVMLTSLHAGSVGNNFPNCEEISAVQTNASVEPHREKSVM